MFAKIGDPIPLVTEDVADDDTASENAMAVLREMGYAMFEPAEAMLARMQEESDAKGLSEPGRVRSGARQVGKITGRID